MCHECYAYFLKNKPQDKKCHRGHFLYYSNDQTTLYCYLAKARNIQPIKLCDECRNRIYENESIHCRICKYDVCMYCYTHRI